MSGVEAAREIARESTTLVGEDAELLQSVRVLYGTRDDGKRMSTAKLLALCMKQTLETREKTMMAWSEMMVGMRSAMEELGIDKQTLDVISWSSGLVQRVLSGSVPASVAVQMTDVADDWMKDEIRRRLEVMS